MTQLILFHKPFNVLCQFTGEGETLAKFIPIADIYAAGRLDKDSEGLLLLTDNGVLQHQLTDPKHKVWKTYWVQVEGVPDTADLKHLAKGVELKDGFTRPGEARYLSPHEVAQIWSRHPPIRQRMRVADTWIELKIAEGKNRQVRRMTAALGYPTLRLIRMAIGDYSLQNLAPGEYRILQLPQLPATKPSKPTRIRPHPQSTPPKTSASGRIPPAKRPLPKAAKPPQNQE